jgi:hypothetical protein
MICVARFCSIVFPLFPLYQLLLPEKPQTQILPTITGFRDFQIAGTSLEVSELPEAWLSKSSIIGIWRVKPGRAIILTD